MEATVPDNRHNALVSLPHICTSVLRVRWWNSSTMSKDPSLVDTFIWFDHPAGWKCYVSASINTQVHILQLTLTLANRNIGKLRKKQKKKKKQLLRFKIFYLTCTEPDFIPPRSKLFGVFKVLFCKVWSPAHLESLLQKLYCHIYMYMHIFFVCSPTSHLHLCRITFVL